MIHPARTANFNPQAANRDADALRRAETFSSPRREPRSAAHLTFAVCGLTSSGRFFIELCSTVNVSRSGCCLRLHTRPQAESALVLRAVPGGTNFPEGTSQLLFQLAWARPGDGGWMIGAFALGESGLWHLAFPPCTP